jgi:hypothetical protein
MSSRVRCFIAAICAICVSLVTVGCGSQHPKQAAGGSVSPPGWGAPAPKSVLDQTTAPIVTFSMYDDITLSLIPRDAIATAGYNPPSSWPTYSRLHAAFPAAHNVSIAISSDSRGECGDFEPGDMTPSEVGRWVRFDQAGGYEKPCVYSSYYEYVHEIRPALTADGIKRSTIFEWDADYTYQPHLDPGFDATQFTDRALGRSLDESLVSRDFLEKAAVPAYVQPKPKPAPKAPVCFGSEAQIHSAKCAAPRSEVAALYKHFHTELATYQARGCPVLLREHAYFATGLREHRTYRRAHREAALASITDRQAKAKCGTLGAGARSLGASIQRIVKEFA